MTITITNCKLAPKWTTINHLVREATGQPGTLVRIARRDNGVDYRALGEYDLSYRIHDSLDVLHVTLSVE